MNLYPSYNSDLLSIYDHRVFCSAHRFHLNAILWRKNPCYLTSNYPESFPEWDGGGGMWEVGGVSDHSCEIEMPIVMYNHRRVQSV